MTDFYQAFENKYRGSRESIVHRLLVYLPFVEQLKQVHSSCNAVDLGCGRGEWLEVLTEHSVVAHGVDLDDDMLADCRERGFSVVTGDAIAYLSDLADASQDVVSGFHIAEHLPFVSLQALVREALRVLKPAGLLILETPNPENVVVGTTNFYLDPTHERPIPPLLLEFLPEYYGFHRTKIMRLQESPSLVSSNEPTLFNVLGGVSPDYAVVAQKIADPKVLESFEDLFSQSYGLSLEMLSMKYERHNQQNLTAAIQLAEGKVSKLNDELNIVKSKIDELSQSFHHWWTVADGLRNELRSVYKSKSWRLTFPLRKLMQFAKLLFLFSARTIRWLIRLPKSTVNWLLTKAMDYSLKHPALKSWAKTWLHNCPSLDARLRRLAAARGFVVKAPETQFMANQAVSESNEFTASTEDFPNLTPGARRSYGELKNAIEERKKENS